jgi:hypothetical protein
MTTESNTKRLAALTLAQKVRIVEIIKAAPADRPDVDVAADASAAIERAVSAQLIGTYRKDLGLQSVKQPTRAELRRRLEAVERALAEAKQVKLPLVGGGEIGSSGGIALAGGAHDEQQPAIAMAQGTSAQIMGDGLPMGAARIYGDEPISEQLTDKANGVVGEQISANPAALQASPPVFATQESGTGALIKRQVPTLTEQVQA